MTTQYLSPQTAKNGNIELCYDAFGKPENPALLLIMGLGDQMITWPDEFCEKFVQKGFFVIRFDNRDTGLSTKFNLYKPPSIAGVVAKKLFGLTPKTPYTLSDMAADGIAVLDALNIESAHIMGASMGGMIAQVMGLDHPGRVKSVISMISAARLRPAFTIARDFCVNHIRSALPNNSPDTFPSPSISALKILVSESPKDRESFADFYIKIEKVLVGPGGKIDIEMTRELAYRLYDRGLNPQGMERQFAAILAAPDRRERLKFLEPPMLVIHSDADPLIPFGLGKETAMLAPGARLKVIREMGHWLPINTWDEVVEEINDFITSRCGDKK